MAQKQRAVRIEQKGGLAAMQQLESRSDDELEGETRYKAAAQAILGARAAERYDAKATRAYFQRALAAARPQERMQLRRMANASIALAERRPSELKDAVTKLGQAPPSTRQLLLLRLMGLIAPPPGSSILLRARGVVLLVLLVAAVIAIGTGIVYGVALPFGGWSLGASILAGIVLAVIVIGVMALLGRRRQRRAKAAAQAGS